MTAGGAITVCRARVRRLTRLAALVALGGLVAGCPKPGGVSGGERRAVTQTLVGDWKDGAGTRYRIIRLHGDEPVVAYVAGPDGEPYEIVDQGFTDGAFALTYVVPSNGYRVTITVVSPGEDRVAVRWANDRGASGDDALVRP